MKLWVGITDNNWFQFLNAKAPIDEVNFWRPTTPTPYRKDFFPGMPFLFKLHAPDDYIAGGAFFLKFLPLPLSLAWAAFGEANGASSLENLRVMIGKHARISPGKDPHIGCNLLSDRSFFEEISGSRASVTCKDQLFLAKASLTLLKLRVYGEK